MPSECIKGIAIMAPGWLAYLAPNNHMVMYSSGTCRYGGWPLRVASQSIQTRQQNPT